MFHKKRFRSAIALILTLLLTVALASVAAAQDDVGPGPPPPPEPPDTGTPDTGTPDTGTPDPPSPGPDTTVPPVPPVLPPDPTDPDPDTPDPPVMPPDPGNGDGDGDMMMSAPSSWPPPNAIVHHAATPIQISALGGGLHVYLIGPDGASNSGTVIDSFSTLAETYPSGGAVSLYTGTNAGSGKSVTIEYLPTEMKIRVSTYYADQPPHDYNKPYVFIVDADHSVTHEKW